MSDDAINSALLRVQAALEGVDIETALNALAYQTGLLATIGAPTKGAALASCLISQKTARGVVNDCWGREDIEAMRAEVRSTLQ